MRKWIAALPVLVILAASLFLPAIAAEEAQVPGTASGGLQGAATFSEGSAGVEYPDGLVHDVVKGDTLWDLSAKYLGSPWLWPELWERNRFLTNPHYIYPGIHVTVFPPPPREYVMEILEPEPPAASADAGKADAAAATLPEPVQAAPRIADVPEIAVVRAGLFLPQRPAGIGNIRTGVDTRVAFSERDKVFLSLTKEIPAGQLLGVYRVRGPVAPPSGSSVSGYVKYLVGVLQVVEPEDGEVTAVVRKSFEELSRDDQIDEEIPGYAPIVLKPGGEGLEAFVVAGQLEQTEFATGNVVYLDKGSNDGIEVGNFFRVLGGQDEATWGQSRSGEGPVPVEVANVVVVRTLPGSSSAYILGGTQSFPTGVTARRGAGKDGGR